MQKKKEQRKRKKKEKNRKKKKGKERKLGRASMKEEKLSYSFLSLKVDERRIKILP